MCSFNGTQNFKQSNRERKEIDSEGEERREGRGGCNGEKVRGGEGEPGGALRFESIMLNLGLRKELKRHGVKVEEHPHSTILTVLPFELLLQELLLLSTITALA